MTDSNRSVVGAIDTTAFGQSAGSSGSSANPYMWLGDWGYRNDNDAGLVHVGARYYDSQVGRFVTRDTVLTEHPFLYCDGDPVNAMDPSGRRSCLWRVGGLIPIHYYITFPGGSIGFYPHHGRWLPVLPGEGEIRSPDPYAGNGTPIAVVDDPVVDARMAFVAKALASEPAPSYAYIGFNCQDWANVVWQEVVQPPRDDPWRFYGPGLGGL